MSTATLKRERPFKKVYDERYAFRTSQIAVSANDSYADALLQPHIDAGEYGDNEIMLQESHAWYRTEGVVARADFDPPLYLDAKAAHMHWLIDRDSVIDAFDLPSIYEATRSLRKDALMRMKKPDLWDKAVRDGAHNDDSAYKSFTKEMLAEAILDSDERF